LEEDENNGVREKEEDILVLSITNLASSWGCTFNNNKIFFKLSIIFFVCFIDSPSTPTIM